jgi:PAS domain S-box-containing protein
MEHNYVEDPKGLVVSAEDDSTLIVERCEDEPIRVPGSIQRHGFLLVLDEGDQHIVAASENTVQFLEVPLTLLLGTPIATVLEREILGALRASTLPGSESTDLPVYLGSFQLRGRFFSVVTHRVSGLRLIEFELVDRLVSPDLASQMFTNFVSNLSNLRSEQKLCQALAKQVKQLTGYNRILLYRFDEHGHGTVLCEETDGVLPSYLDLRFPASDIPQQARDLYVLNTIRIIPDASYVPSPLLGNAGGPAAALDLSLSILRSVSPVHLEYMRNMGTLSSMSISIVCDGKLWGLVSGHHATPHTVPYLARTACDLLARLVSTQLMGLRSSESLTQMMHFHAVQRQVLTQMAAESNYLAAMADQMEYIQQITNAAGATLVVDGHCTLVGLTPDQEFIARLMDWMDGQPDLEVFQSQELATEMPWAEEFREVASGVLAVRISHIRQNYLLWFRPEVVSTVHWAGEPKKMMNNSSGLHPRTSFETWKELVRGKSVGWTEMEIESATDFRSAIVTISLKRAEEAVQLGEARFLQLTYALPHPVWTADDEGQLTYVNQRWLDLGHRDHGLWYEQEHMVVEDRNRCHDLWEASVEQGEPFDLEVRFQQQAGGVERWNLVRAVPYLRANGGRAGWIGTCTDLTERRQREASLRLAEKLALTGRMTSVIAHEINNPLESLTNILYLLRDVQPDESARNYIGLAESELQRISSITKQTLRWSREGEQKPGFATAGALFNDVLRLFAGQIRNRAVTVVIECGGDIQFYGIIDQIHQVMTNLLSNAIQAVPVGGRISLRCVGDGDGVEMVVRDNGHGMSLETQKSLFQPFFSTKGDLGNGLGLYISHEIVKRHGGTLLVKSQPGQGTEIGMRLPLAGSIEA